MLSSTYIRRIEWGDCDPAGIVFNPRYYAFFDHGAALLFERAGWSPPQLAQAFGCLGVAVVENRGRFLAPSSTGEEVTIASTVADVRRSSLDIRHELRAGDTLRVEGFETRVWIVRDRTTGGIASAPIPDAVKARLSGG